MMNNKPVERFRAGRITCALFENEVDEGGQAQRVVNASLTRRYQDRWGYWKSEFEFAREDLPLAIHVLKRAFETMTDRQIDDEIAREIERAIEEVRARPLPQDAKSPAA